MSNIHRVLSVSTLVTLQDASQMASLPHLKSLINMEKNDSSSLTESSMKLLLRSKDEEQTHQSSGGLERSASIFSPPVETLPHRDAMIHPEISC